MRLDFEDYIIDIVETANAAKQGRFSCAGIRALPAGKAIKTVKDSPGIYFVPGVSKADDAILKVSNKEFPDYIAGEVQKAKVARRALPVGPAEVIPTPIFEGRFSSQSFVFWPKYRPISDQRIIRAVQKRLLYDNLCAWLRMVAVASSQRNFSADVIDRRYRRPLERMSKNNRLSHAFHVLADRALQQLDSGGWSKIGVLEHSDFGLENIFLPAFRQHSANEFGFFVIDWGGSLLDGAPGLDLIRLSMSSNVTFQRARREIMNYISAIQTDAQSFLFEIIRGLAHLGANLNQFPEDRYVALSESILNYLRVLGFLPQRDSELPIAA